MTKCPKCGEIISVRITGAGLKLLDDLGYGTLEQDLTKCFTKRNIEVETLSVTDKCRTYTIRVKRK